MLEDILLLNILVPVGRGGLASGASVAAHGADHRIRITACERWRASDAIDSVREDRNVSPEPADTIAEGLRTSVGEPAFSILRVHVEGFSLVEERQIVEGVRVALKRLNMLIEPSNASALASLLRAEPYLRGKCVGVIVSGGNI